VLDAVRDAGGPSVVDRLLAVSQMPPAHGATGPWEPMSPEDRASSRTAKLTWWPFPTKNTRDRATATFPALLYDRLDELRMDFAVVYPSASLLWPHIDEEDVRLAACQGAVVAGGAAPP
jgi:hypothetical protein